MLCCVGYHVVLIERNTSYITAYFDRQTHLPVKKHKQKAPQNFGERAGQPPTRRQGVFYHEAAKPGYHQTDGAKQA